VVKKKQESTKKLKIFTKKTKIKVVKVKKEPKGIFKPIFAIGRYFKGAWIELKQVRWPNRKAAWGLTLAVILFTAFFFTLIVLLDAGFKELFNIILK